MKYQLDDLIRPSVRELSAYHVADARGLIKLDAMESPYNLPESLVEDWLATLKRVELNRYPGADMETLRERLKTAMAIPGDQSVLMGNGSDELILILSLALVGAPGVAGKPVVMAPEPTFVMYKLSANAVDIDYVGVPLEEETFNLDMPAMRRAIAEHKPAVIYLAWPNNPTGNLFDEQAVTEIVETAPGLVIVDEAYHPFARSTFMDRLGRHENLLVMRTVSKMGLAGIRLGLLAGPAPWIHELDKLRFPYNVNVLTQATALFALDHMDVFDEQAATLRAQRSRLIDALDGREAVRVWPSDANFILFRVPEGRAEAINQSLIRQGVLVKNMEKSFPELADCLRVTVGTPEQNTRFLEALDRALNDNP